MHRRELLHWLVATSGLGAFQRLSVGDLAVMGTDAHRRLVEGPGQGALTSAELGIVVAAAECIIPRTDTPGATDAGVAAFVDLMLGEWYPPDELARFRSGLARLNEGSDFTALPKERQVQVIEAIDREVTALRRSNAGAATTHWFATLKYLTVWGYCTSEVAMRDTFHAFPPPMTYNGAAPLRA